MHVQQLVLPTNMVLNLIWCPAYKQSQCERVEILVGCGYHVGQVLYVRWQWGKQPQPTVVLPSSMLLIDITI